MKTRSRLYGYGVLGSLMVMSCARQSAPPASVLQRTEALRNLSTVAVGSGYDRARDVELPACFERGTTTVTPVREWLGAGFPLFTVGELETRVRTAIGVGVKIESRERKFTESTAQHIDTSKEASYFMLLARYTARKETAGDLWKPGSPCANLPSNSQNGIEDFVSACGDRYLAEKVYGGHVLISWRRDTSRAQVDDLMGTMLGARRLGATVDPLANLTALEAKGLGREEVFVEASSSFPLRPKLVPLPNGQLGYTVESAREFLEELARVNVTWFAEVTDYSLAPYTVAEADTCLAVTGQRSTLTEPEWSCVENRITELADLRDGAGDLAFLQDRYELHKLALNEQSSRLTFSTVPQSQCAVDADGDPDLERSGPCQLATLEHFVKFYEECTDRSAQTLGHCREQVLPQTQSCSDFEASGCTPPKMTLSNGTVVKCDEAGINAALADVVPYEVTPPFTPATTPGTFVPPLVMQFRADSMIIRQIPGVSTATDLCGITGVSGGLGSASLTVEAWGPDWMVMVIDLNTDPDKRASLEVTCVKFSNFYHLNGGSHSISDSSSTPVPDLNGSGYSTTLHAPGNPVFGGWLSYLDEPATTLFVTNPDSSGFGKLFSTDLFPFASSTVYPFTYTLQTNQPRSGRSAGGSLMDPTTGKLSNLSASIELTNRSPANMSRALSNDAFCYLTGISGRFFNSSDSVRISTSNGFTTLTVTTPLTKDRNPGAIAQCALFDQY